MFETLVANTLYARKTSADERTVPQKAFEVFNKKHTKWQEMLSLCWKGETFVRELTLTILRSAIGQAC